MKLHLTTAQNQHLITGYSLDNNAQFIEVNNQRYVTSLIVMADQLILNWPVADFANLSQAHFAQIKELKLEVLLLGTGQHHQFLHPKITQQLTNNNIAIECMTTAAACRTYNFLMSEGRNVAAALMIEADKIEN